MTTLAPMQRRRGNVRNLQFHPVRKRAYSNLSLVEPNLVEPSLVEPSFVDPNFVDPNLVEPSLVEPNFVDASLFADILVEVNWLTSGLVMMAFLVAMRLLISDFFSMDIACSYF